jgi:hypothetical protein
MKIGVSRSKGIREASRLRRTAEATTSPGLYGGGARHDTPDRLCTHAPTWKGLALPPRHNRTKLRLWCSPGHVRFVARVRACADGPARGVLQ